MRAKKLIVGAFASMLLVTAPSLAADQLPSFNVDLTQTTVSGLSSGAFMALQFHVAYSGTVRGAGVVAGGPYLCAQGQLAIALTQCMHNATPPPNPAGLVAAARRFAQDNRIDRLENLADDRAYLFAGTNDTTVPSVVVDAAQQFYLQVGLPAANLHFQNDLAAGHAMVTEDFGGACSRTGPPFINDCDFDLAGAILKQLYGNLNPPAGQPSGRVSAFDQAEFFHFAPAAPPSGSGVGFPPMGPLSPFPFPPTAGAGSPFPFPFPMPPTPGMGGDTLSLHHTGFAYIPASCAARASCRVHIVFHGCQQTPDDIRDQYVTRTGYNRWADSNNIIVLYPQIRRQFPANANGCWDWFGYTGAAYATKAGPQMAVMRAMLGRLAGE